MIQVSRKLRCFLHLLAASCPMALAFSTSAKQSQSNLVATLQQCVTPEQVLDRVVRHTTASNDPDHALGSVAWTRLCKLMVALDNQRRYAGREQARPDSQPVALVGRRQEAAALLANLVQQMRDCNPSDSRWTTSAATLIDATKSASVVVRLLLKEEQEAQDVASGTDWNISIAQPLLSFWNAYSHAHDMQLLPSHQLSGLYWALDGLCSTASAPQIFTRVPLRIEEAYERLALPFRIYPSCLQQHRRDHTHSIKSLELYTLLSQVQFSVGDQATILNALGQPVQERRQTAWQGDDTVGPFAYSGKSMDRQAWSPLVRQTRDILQQVLPPHGTRQSHGCFYDCCLINHYYDGRSAMRYHADPDQGTLWDYDTAVVSIGATRRFAFRENESGTIHSFYVLDGDVTHMFGDCQETYQHAVKKAESKMEMASRASLVFKRSLAEATG